MTGTTREELAEWFDEGVRQGAAFMIVAADTFSYENYPVYVHAGGDKTVHELAQEFEHKPMSRVMEVYALDGDKEAQIAANETWAIPRPEPGESTRSVEESIRLLETGHWVPPGYVGPS
jgi:hypothetical protein